jgi:LuxR family transcriptional regulator, maltose regulon positive regulatory protein
MVEICRERVGQGDFRVHDLDDPIDWRALLHSVAEAITSAATAGQTTQPQPRLALHSHRPAPLTGPSAASNGRRTGSGQPSAQGGRVARSRRQPVSASRLNRWSRFRRPSPVRLLDSDTAACQFDHDDNAGGWVTIRASGVTVWGAALVSTGTGRALKRSRSGLSGRVPLIRSKLQPPALPRGLVSRGRLLEELRKGRSQALTLVCAPAGYGKTTLLSEWIDTDADSAGFAWVALDAGDADPTRFWTYLVSALSTITPSAGRRSLPALSSRPERLKADVLPLLLAELEEGDRNLVLVLEDYHLAECPSVAESMAFLVEHRPAHLQVVLSTRSDPQLPLGRWRANDRLAEIRADHLRFGDREVADFFDRAGIDGLSRAELAKQKARTEGWPAVLRLAAILLGSLSDRGEFVQAFTGSHRQVVDYLATDVLETVSPAIRAFLLRTSVLARLCGPLCDAVAGAERSGATLRELSRANLFISPVDVDGRWYRYHQLFAEALRLELEVTEPQLVPGLHARASSWFEREGDLESATEHAIAARDTELSKRLVLRQIQPLVGAGHLATADRWLMELSWPEARQDPELAVVRALAAGERSQPDEAGRWLDVAGRGPRDRMTSAGVSLGYGVDLLRSFFVAGGVSSAHEAALRALDEAPTPMWRGAALTGLGQCRYLLGNLDGAADALREALTLLPDDLNMLSLASGYLALVECDQGNPRQGERVARRIVDLVESRDFALSGTTAMSHTGLGAALAARGHLAEADDRLSLAVGLHRIGNPSVWLAHALLLLAGCRHASGDAPRAREALDLATATLDRIPDPGVLPALAASLRGRLLAPTRRPATFGQELSKREVVVLTLLAAGLSQREIAAQLYLSHNTVKTHVRVAYRKLGAGTRTQALHRATDLGVL